MDLSAHDMMHVVHVCMRSDMQHVFNNVPQVDGRVVHAKSNQEAW